MAAVTKVSPQPPATIALPPCNRPAEKMIAGEDIGILDAVYVASTGLVMKATGAVANAAARVRGFALRAIKSGEPATFGFGFVAQYGTGLVPGADYFLGAVAGGLDTAATVGGTAPVAFAMDATRVFFMDPK